VVVEWIVADIDGIVRLVRFPGWQYTKAGEREVQKALRKVVYVKYKIKDQDLFDKAFILPAVLLNSRASYSASDIRRTQARFWRCR